MSWILTLYVRVVSEAPDGVVILDREGVIRYWNRGAERIFGRTGSEMIGSALDVIIPARLRQRHWDGFRAAMARGSTKYGDADLLAVPAIAADGRTAFHGIQHRARGQCRGRHKPCRSDHS